MFGGIVSLISRIPGIDAVIRSEGTNITAELNTLQALLLLLLGLGWAVAFGLAILVILEVIVPTGSLPRLVPWPRRFAPQEIRAALEDQLVTLLPLLHRLPRRIGAITEGFERGRSVLSVRILADEGDRSFVIGVVQQLTITLLAAACAIGGIVLLTADTRAPHAADGAALCVPGGHAAVLRLRARRAGTGARVPEVGADVGIKVRDAP